MGRDSFEAEIGVEIAKLGWMRPGGSHFWTRCERCLRMMVQVASHPRLCRWIS